MCDPLTLLGDPAPALGHPNKRDPALQIDIHWFIIDGFLQRATEVAFYADAE